MRAAAALSNLIKNTADAQSEQSQQYSAAIQTKVSVFVETLFDREKCLAVNVHNMIREFVLLWLAIEPYTKLVFRDGNNKASVRRSLVEDRLHHKKHLDEWTILHLALMSDAAAAATAEDAEDAAAAKLDTFLNNKTGGAIQTAVANKTEPASPHRQTFKTVAKAACFIVRLQRASKCRHGCPCGCITLQKHLLDMFTQCDGHTDGHTVCARWAALSKSLDHNRLHTLGEGKFAEDLVEPLFKWLQVTVHPLTVLLIR